MTDQVIPDLLETARVVERGGWLQDTTRTFFLKGVTGTSVGTIVYNALTEPGLPVAGEILSSQFQNMRVVQREAEIVSFDGTKADVKVTISYESGPLSLSDGGYTQPEGDPAMPYSIPLRGGANLAQVTTARNRSGSLILLDYTDTETNIENSYPVKVDVYDVHGTFTRETIEATNNPDSIVDEWINKVNSTMFRGKPPKTWLCSDIQYELVSQWQNPMLYRFTWQFESKPTKWIYEAFYEDEEGNIPADVGTIIDQQENGVVTVNWHEEKNFNEKFAYP